MRIRLAWFLGIVFSAVMLAVLAKPKGDQSKIWTTEKATEGNHILQIRPEDTFLWIEMAKSLESDEVILTKYNKEKRQLEEFNIPDDMAGGNLSLIAKDEEEFWIRTKNVFLRYYKATGKWEEYPEDNYVRIFKMDKFDKNLVWAYIIEGTYLGHDRISQIVCYDKVKKTRTAYTIKDMVGDTPLAWPGSTITGLEIDKHAVWVGVHGVCLTRYDRLSKTWTPVDIHVKMKHDVVPIDIVKIVEDDIWMKLAHIQGAVRYNKTSGTTKIYKTSKDILESIVTIVRDENLIWFGGYGLKGPPLSRYNMTSDEWTGYNLVFWKEILHLQVLQGCYMTVSGIYPDGQFVWFRTNDGLYKFNKKSEAWTEYTTKHGLAGHELYSIAIDDDRIWVGTDKGLSWALKDKLYSEK